MNNRRVNLNWLAALVLPCSLALVGCDDGNAPKVEPAGPVQGASLGAPGTPGKTESPVVKPEVTPPATDKKDNVEQVALKPLKKVEVVDPPAPAPKVDVPSVDPVPVVEPVTQDPPVKEQGPDPEIKKPKVTEPDPGLQLAKVDVDPAKTVTPDVAEVDEPQVGPDGQEHPSLQQLAESTPLPEGAKIEGYLNINFNEMADFPYYVLDPDDPDMVIGPEEAADDEQAKKIKALAKLGDKQIPKEVQDLHGKKVTVVGFMIPIEFDKGTTNEFVLIRVVPSCFFCQKPQITDWIEIKVEEGKRFECNTADPLQITGTMKIGAVREDGIVTSIFRMEADGMTNLADK